MAQKCLPWTTLMFVPSWLTTSSISSIMTQMTLPRLGEACIPGRLVSSIVWVLVGTSMIWLVVDVIVLTRTKKLSPLWHRLNMIEQAIVRDDASHHALCTMINTGPTTRLQCYTSQAYHVHQTGQFTHSRLAVLLFLQFHLITSSSTVIEHLKFTSSFKFSLICRSRICEWRNGDATCLLDAWDLTMVRLAHSRHHLSSV